MKIVVCVYSGALRILFFSWLPDRISRFFYLFYTPLTTPISIFPLRRRVTPKSFGPRIWRVNYYILWDCYILYFIYWKAGISQVVEVKFKQEKSSKVEYISDCINTNFLTRTWAQSLYIAQIVVGFPDLWKKEKKEKTKNNCECMWITSKDG